MKEKFQKEEEKNKAVSEALDEVIHDKNEMNKIVNEIENAEIDKNRDKFTKKYAFVVQSAIYRSESGLPDLK